MASTIAQKLRIKEEMTILVLNAPADYKQSLGPVPPGVTVTGSTKNFDQVHWFVKKRAQMEKDVKKTIRLISDDVLCWIFYPKRSSKIQTDLTRDNGWDELMKYDLQWISLISFDDTWSAFAMRQRNEADKKRKINAQDRPILNYIDPKNKKVTLPTDFASALKINHKEEEFFNTLSFSNKKEYIEWIVTAKRAETRNARVKESVTKLGKKWKNPRNL